MINNAVKRAQALLTPPHQDEESRRASRAEAVAILRSSLVPLMRGDCPEAAERILNVALDLESK